MITIDKEIMCKFCREYYKESESWNCEGSQCEEIEEIYLEYVGVKDIYFVPEKRTFLDLKINDILYFLSEKERIPEIKEHKVTQINLRQESLDIYSPESSFSVPLDAANANSFENLFLYKKDCQRALEELCVNQIIQLSKVIGYIQGKGGKNESKK